VVDEPLCGAGVVDHRTCRPLTFGAGQWRRYEHFPPLTLSEFSGRADARELAAEIRAHYLGSLYYDDDVHSFCKSQFDFQWSESRNTILQEYELSRVIEERTVRPVTTQLHEGLLRTRNAHEAASIADRFYENLMEEIGGRVSARIVWFVVRYPGGGEDMAHDDRLQRCIRDARVYDADVITGVAGYAILADRLDHTVAAEEVVHRSLTRALSRYDFALHGGLRASLARYWVDNMRTIANARVTRQDVTMIAWPLWVQFW
jgi:hypothetical protein